MDDPGPLLPPPTTPRPTGYRRGSGFWGGIVLVLVGVYFLLLNLGFLNWLSFDIVWPVVLIAIGVYLVVRRLR
jgi:NhaP-type Na+/H+ or K+/H+ antiporter